MNMNNTREYASYGCVSMKLSVFMDNALTTYYPHVRIECCFGSIFQVSSARLGVTFCTEQACPAEGCRGDIHGALMRLRRMQPSVVLCAKIWCLLSVQHRPYVDNTIMIKEIQL
jgi:hypothetical protein